jgi:hypothetical protein
MTLTWPAAEHSFGVAEYHVFQEDVMIATVEGTAQTYCVTNLEPETYYAFKIEASDPWGTSSTDGPALRVRTLTPAEAIGQLISDVMDLNLQQGIENSLDAKLDAAFQALDDLNEDNDVAALNALQAFINAVEAQRDKQISGPAADDLINAAQEIIAVLSS